MVLVVALGLGVGGIALLHSTTPFNSARPSASATTAIPAARQARSLSDEAIYARVKPSVVDVTVTLRYDDETAWGTGFFVDSRYGLTSIVSACRPGSVVEITWVSPAGATRASRVRLDSAPAL